MYKNQLQELAQRSCFNLPAYSCIREGPDHAPRFKSVVNFNGETFESPSFCSTLRQAEHAAAEVALNTLSKRGPSQSLGARMLDETGVCKNLLQETAQRAGASLPVYTTIRSGPGHLPVFTCIVEVAGMKFVGEVAKTKKQAEKNAAMTALSALKLVSTPQCGEAAGRKDHDPSPGQGKNDAHSTEHLAMQPFSTRRSVRVVHSRDRSVNKEGGAWIQSGSSLHAEARQGFRRVFNQEQAAGSSNRTSSPLRPLLTQSSWTASVHDPSISSREASAASRANANAAGNMVRLMPVRIKGLPSCGRNEVNPPLEEHLRDEEEWLRGEASKASLQKEETTSYIRRMWSGCSQNWGSQSSPTSTTSYSNPFQFRPVASMAPPVRIRQVATVCSAPPPRGGDRSPQVRGDESTPDQESATVKIFGQLRL